MDLEDNIVKLIQNEKFKQALRLLEPMQPVIPWIFYKAQILYKTNHPKEALDILLKIEKEYPKKIEILNEIGIVYSIMQQKEQALAYFFKCTTINPNFANAYNNLGVESFLEENYAKARIYFERAIQEDPNFIEAWFNLRDTYEAMGEIILFQWASKSYDQLIKGK